MCPILMVVGDVIIGDVGEKLNDERTAFNSLLVSTFLTVVVVASLLPSPAPSPNMLRHSKQLTLELSITLFFSTVFFTFILDVSLFTLFALVETERRLKGGRVGGAG